MGECPDSARRCPSSGVAAADKEDNRETQVAFVQRSSEVDAIHDVPVETEDQATTLREIAIPKELRRAAEVLHVQSVRFQEHLERIPDDIVLIDEVDRLVIDIGH
jgi:hypothetical protein